MKNLNGDSIMKKIYQLIENRKYFVIKDSRYHIDDELRQAHFKFFKLTGNRIPVACVREYTPNRSFINFYYESEIFYDIEEIRDNARKAIQSMEQRSLNLILKLLINENFEW